MKRTSLMNLAHGTLPYRLLKPRRAQLYCVGTAKSGTHSVAAVFRTQLRARHEAESEAFIDLIVAAHEGRVSPAQVARTLRARDRRLWLEVDSSQLNYFFLEPLVELFPRAKFILTMRDCYSWLDSFINHQLARTASPNWERLRALRFQADRLRHSPEEEVLRRRGLYTLDGYLSYWATHNRRVLDLVPADRLLVVRTHEIAQQTQRIAQFAGLPVETADPEKSHAFKAKAKLNVLAELDPAYLEQKVGEHCGALMAAYFPEIRSAEDVLPGLACGA